MDSIGKETRPKPGKWRDPGMRRVRLCFWHLFRNTPLKHIIDESAERAAAAHCKVSWEHYLAWKRDHAELWGRCAAKRVRAIRRGAWPEQPWQLRAARVHLVPQRAKRRKERPRFVEWGFGQLQRQRGYKQAWRRHQLLDRIFFQIHR